MEKQHKIMIVDDSQIVTELTAFIMEQLGYETVQFTDGQQAIEYLDATENPFPELIVCDHYLGSRSDIRKNGFRILNKLKQYGVHIPVVIASGTNDERVVNKYYEMGVSGFVSKDTPNYIDELERVVMKTLGQE
jgi:two-component system phosphate regulon response regulator PhoB